MACPSCCSAHDQTLIDGARRLLHDAGFNVLAALAKPLLADDLLRLLKTLYLGPQRQRRLSGLRRTIRTWQGKRKGCSGSCPIPVALAHLAGGDRLAAALGAGARWLVQQGRGLASSPAHPPARPPAEPGGRFALVLQASLAGAKLALLLDNDQHIPFDLLERMPLQHLLLGQSLLPGLEAMTPDSLLGRFINRARGSGSPSIWTILQPAGQQSVARSGRGGALVTVARYLCWPPDEARLRRALAGWLHPHSGQPCR